MKKKKEGSEYFFVEKSDVKSEVVIESYLVYINITHPHPMTHIECASSKKEADAIAQKVWKTGKSDSLVVDPRHVSHITIKPVKKTRYWFEKSDTL